jgi:hypothetical protein
MTELPAASIIQAAVSRHQAARPAAGRLIPISAAAGGSGPCRRAGIPGVSGRRPDRVFRLVPVAVLAQNLHVQRATAVPVGEAAGARRLCVRRPSGPARSGQGTAPRLGEYALLPGPLARLLAGPASKGARLDPLAQSPWRDRVGQGRPLGGIVEPVPSLEGLLEQDQRGARADQVQGSLDRAPCQEDFRNPGQRAGRSAHLTLCSHSQLDRVLAMLSYSQNKLGCVLAELGAGHE